MAFAQKQVKHYGDNNIKYEYIHVPYASNDIVGSNNVERNIIQDVNDIIKRQGAHLIVIEAAAGFGKTCTAFELFHSLKIEQTLLSHYLQSYLEIEKLKI